MSKVGSSLSGESHNTTVFHFEKLWNIVEEGENYDWAHIHQSIDTLKLIFSIRSKSPSLYPVDLYLSEGSQDCDAPLTRHGYCRVDAPGERDVYEEEQVGQEHREHGLLSDNP